MLKSVLKKQPNPAGPTALSRDARNREIALHHALLIQQQKEVEARVLKAIEALVEFPDAADADPASPSLADAIKFKEWITEFQPSDYDSLIEERHAANKCGYALCPRPPRRQDTRARFRLLRGSGKGQELRVVATEKLVDWCSAKCAQRAMYVKVQLDEEPAWLRRGSEAAPIKLMTDQPRSVEGSAISHQPDNQALSQLARERGESTTPAKSSGLISSNVVERIAVAAATPPVKDAGHANTSHFAVEGFEPGSGTYNRSEEDRDWL